MENFFKRLKYYGIGFGIGLLFVIFLFREKGCSWTPENRVKDSVLQKIVFVDSLDSVYLSKMNVNASALQTIIKGGKISFLDSKRSGNEKIYVFYSQFPSGKVCTFLVALREKSFVVDIDFNHTNPKDYIPLTSPARPFLFKKNSNWFSGKWKNFDLQNLSNKNLPENFTKAFFKNGTLTNDYTNLSQSQPKHSLQFLIQDKTSTKIISCTAHWYREKIEVDELIIQEK